jgi:hypothetical protein
MKMEKRLDAVPPTKVDSWTLSTALSVVNDTIATINWDIDPVFKNDWELEEADISAPEYKQLTIYSWARAKEVLVRAK